MLSPDGHFLSAHNPLATAVQRDAEARAIRLLNASEVQRGREQMALRWQTIVARDMTAEARARFDEMVEEFCFSYVLKAVNEDPNPAAAWVWSAHTRPDGPCRSSTCCSTRSV